MAIRGIDGFSAQAGGGPEPNEYTVQQGETFESIAGKYGLSTDQLQNLNPQIKDPASIRPGQVLNITIPTEAADKQAPYMFQQDAIEQSTADLFAPVSAGEALQEKVIWNESLDKNLLPGEVLQMKMTAEQFQSDAGGKLILSNNTLIGLLKSLAQQNAGKTLNLNFTRLPGEAILNKAASETFPSETDALAFNFGQPSDSFGSAELTPEVAEFYKQFVERRQEPGALDPEKMRGLTEALSNSKTSGEERIILQKDQITDKTIAPEPQEISVRVDENLFDLTPEGNMKINNEQLGNFLKSFVGQISSEDFVAFHWD